MKYDKIRDFAKKDTILSHLLSILIHILRHYLSQVVVSILGTIIIAILISNNQLNVLFFVSCVVYVALEIGIGFCGDYDRRLKEDLVSQIDLLKKESNKIRERNNNLVAVNRSQIVMHASAGKDIYRIAKRVKHDGWTFEMPYIRETFGFQKMCMQACREIYRFCIGINPEANYYVTVFQRVSSDGGTRDKCRMIAFANNDGTEPLSYHTEYPLISKKQLNNGKAKVPLHSELFIKNELQNCVITDPEIIAKKFVYHEQSTTREKRIRAYIGIPVSICNRELSVLLQVDCDKSNGFGENQDEAQKFAEEMIKPYAAFIAMIYEFDRMNEVSNDYIHETERKGAHVDQKQ